MEYSQNLGRLCNCDRITKRSNSSWMNQTPKTVPPCKQQSAHVPPPPKPRGQHAPSASTRLQGSVQCRVRQQCSSQGQRFTENNSTKEKLQEILCRALSLSGSPKSAAARGIRIQTTSLISARLLSALFASWHGHLAWLLCTDGIIKGGTTAVRNTSSPSEHRQAQRRTWGAD